MRPPPRILATQRMPPTTKTSDPETGEQPAGYVGPMPADPAPTPDPTAAATEAMPPALGVMAAGDRCANCGSPMAHDQRYCLECGERRGQPRFTVPADATVTTTTTVRGATGFQRFSSGTTLIAGIATLLLAMGVGVLIGRSGNSSPASNSKVQVLSVGTSGSVCARPLAARARRATHSPSSSAKSGVQVVASHRGTLELDRWRQDGQGPAAADGHGRRQGQGRRLSGRALHRELLRRRRLTRGPVTPTARSPA